MGKIDLDAAPRGQGTRYPAPHDLPCRNRRWLRLGDAAGLTRFGVNLVTLEPGGQTTLSGRERPAPGAVGSSPASGRNGDGSFAARTAR